MLFASAMLRRHRSGLAAYNDLQCRLLRRFLARGGSMDDWCARLAPAFRARYGWMMTPPA